MCMIIFPAYMLCTVCMQCPPRLEEDIALPATGVTEGCKPPVGVGNWIQVLWKCALNHWGARPLNSRCVMAERQHGTKWIVIGSWLRESGKHTMNANLYNHNTKPGIPCKPTANPVTMSYYWRTPENPQPLQCWLNGFPRWSSFWQEVVRWVTRFLQSFCNVSTLVGSKLGTSDLVWIAGSFGCEQKLFL